jgi:hypothetical protein
MKTLKFLALCLIGAFGLYSCGSDEKDDKKEEKNKVYLVKNITCTYTDGDFSKTSFTYENSKITKVTETNNFNGYMSTDIYSYPSANTINYSWENDETIGEGIITMNATENVVANIEYSSYYKEDGERFSEKGVFSYSEGYLAKVSSDEYGYNLNWIEGNLTTFKDPDYSSNITYSDVNNNTNLDYYLWLNFEDVLFSTSQFIKNVSKNIPSSIKSDGSLSTITTTLDEKGRPAKMVIDGDTYTFEYYE